MKNYIEITQINILNLVTIRQTISWYLTKLNSEWLLGFWEGDGSLSGSEKQALFIICQNAEDKLLLEAIKLYFGVGYIYYNLKDNCFYYVVGNRKEILDKIIPFLNGRIKSKIRHQQFTGWCNKYFPEVKVLDLSNQPISDSWLTGFVDAEGSFFFVFRKSRSKLGIQFQPSFDIAQKKEDQLLFEIAETKFNNTNHWALEKTIQHLRIVKQSALIKLVEPFFVKNQLLTRKSLSFLVWQTGLEMVQNKDHLTDEGIKIGLDLKKLLVED